MPSSVSPHGEARAREHRPRSAALRSLCGNGVHSAHVREGHAQRRVPATAQHRGAPRLQRLRALLHLPHVRPPGLLRELGVPVLRHRPHLRPGPPRRDGARRPAALRERGDRTLQLARPLARDPVRQLRPHAHASGGHRRRRPGGVRDRRGGEAAAAVRARGARAPDPRRAALRPALERPAAGDHGPRGRARHARPRGVRRRPPRGDARADGRALPDRARPPAPRGRPPLLDRPGAGRGHARAGPHPVRRRARGLPGRPRPALRAGPPARLGRAPRQRLRDHASVRGLGGDVRALPAHPRHAADRGRLPGDDARSPSPARARPSPARWRP